MDSNKDNLDIYYLWDVTIKNMGNDLIDRPSTYEVAAAEVVGAYEAAFAKARRGGQTPRIRVRAFIKGIAFAYDRTAAETRILDQEQIAELWATDPHNPNREQA